MGTTVSRESEFLSACAKGKIASVQKLLDDGVNIDTVDAIDTTALMFASKNGHTELVELLLKRGANTQKLDSQGFTALIHACQQGHADVVDSLAKDVDLEYFNYDSYHALYWTIYRGHENVLKVLLKNADLQRHWTNRPRALKMACDQKQDRIVELLVLNGMDVNEKYGYEEETNLMQACMKGNESIVKTLIKLGANIHMTNRVKETALMYACKSGHIEIIKILKIYGADIHATDHFGKTALMHAVGRNETACSCIELLLEYGSDVNATDGKDITALINACRYGNIDIVKLLLANKADVDSVFKMDTNTNTLSKIGKSALMYSCIHGYGNIVDVLIVHGATLSIADKKGKTALMLSAIHRKVSIAEALLNEESNLEVDVADVFGKTALMYACYAGISPIVEMLLNRGAKCNLMCYNNKTPLMYACCNVNNGADVIELLLTQKDVDIDKQDKSGNTALMFAAHCGNDLIVEKLLQNGADPNLIDKKGRSVLHYVMRHNHHVLKQPNLIKLLLKFGARQMKDCIGRHIFTIALTNDNYDVIQLLDKEGCLLSNGRLRAECRAPCPNVKTGLLLYIMDQGLFEWSLLQPKHLNSEIDILLMHAIEIGISPGVIKRLKNGLELSLLHLSLLTQDVNTMEILIKHLYFSPEDYVIRLYYYRPFPVEFCNSEIINDFMTQPLSLFKWSFLTVSKALSLTGSPYARPQKIDALPIPESLKNTMKFFMT